MNKTIIIFILAIAGLVWWGRSNQASGPSQAGAGTNGNSSLIASETFYDFGTISMKNGLVSHIFKVTNSTGRDIEVKTVNTSCMFTKAYIESVSGEKGPFGMPGMGFVPPANELIKAGDSRDIKVVYDPNAHGPAGVGAIDRFVYLTDANGETLGFEIKAVVTP